MQRTNLKILRVKLHLSQHEAAQKIGCSRATYAAIESGARNGRKDFWNALQTSLNIPPGEMWALMLKDNEA